MFVIFYRTSETTKRMPGLQNGFKNSVWLIPRRSSGKKGSRNGQRDTTRGCLGQPWRDNRWKKVRKVLLPVSIFLLWKMKGLDKTRTSGDQKRNDIIMLSRNPRRQLPLGDGVILPISRTLSPSNHRSESRRRRIRKTDGRGQMTHIAWLMKPGRRKRERRKERIRKLQAILQTTLQRLSLRMQMVACTASTNLVRQLPFKRKRRQTKLFLNMNYERASSLLFRLQANLIVYYNFSSPHAAVTSSYTIHRTYNDLTHDVLQVCTLESQ